MNFESVDAANDLLSNGILVETSKGLICLSLNDALSSSDLNLSVEALQSVAAQLLLQDNTPKPTKKESNILSGSIGSALVSSDGLGDSDGFTSESSEPNFKFQNSKICPALVPIKKPTLDAKPIKSLTMGCLKKDSFVSISMQSCNTKLIEVEFNSNISDSDGSTVIKQLDSTIIEPKEIDSSKPLTKKRGGWPKGRKRKPELLHLPPKAPATGYNLYLNDQRKLFKNSNLLFHEITKLIGNKWSSLSLGEKKPYLEKAEEEKRRYREEFRIYRQSGSYQLYLANKRRKRAKYNVLSESDMDATDDLDEEDNEELYCRTCDQWFHNMHNKREHLQGRQHMQAIMGAIRSELESDYDDTDGHPGNTSSMSLSTSLDESSMDAAMPPSSRGEGGGGGMKRVAMKSVGGAAGQAVNVTDSIHNLMSVIGSREREIKTLQTLLHKKKETNADMHIQCSTLKELEKKLRKDFTTLKEQEKEMESKVFNLWQVPSWFVINNVKDMSETIKLEDSN